MGWDPMPPKCCHFWEQALKLLKHVSHSCSKSFRGTWKMLTARHLVLGLWRLCGTEQIYCLKYTAGSVTRPCVLPCCYPLEGSSPNRVPHTCFCKFIKWHGLKTQWQRGKHTGQKSYSSSRYTDQAESFYLCLHLFNHMLGTNPSGDTPTPPPYWSECRPQELLSC